MSAPPQTDEQRPLPTVAAPLTRLDRVLALVPRALSSHVHIIFLGALGLFLVFLPLVGVHVSANAELIGGNYTNVTSDLGACIAAGLTVHLVRREHRRAAELRQLIGSLQDRHGELEQRLAEVLTAAKEAERHARRAAEVGG